MSQYREENRKKSTSLGRASKSYAFQLHRLESRVYLAAVASTTPLATGIGVGVSAHISVTFTTPMDASTINSQTYRVLDGKNRTVSGRVSYNPFNRTATFDVTTPLSYNQTYRAVVSGGKNGVKDSSNGTLGGDYSWSFTTAMNPIRGHGGPILVITSQASSFSTYYAEILRAEGFNAFSTADIGSVTANVLKNYSVVILGQMTLTGDQVTMVSDWVNAGGNLIAMRPDKQLASLLGLTDATGNLSNRYLLVDTNTGPGAGITGETMQFHGAADRYTLNGATAVATIYTDASSGTSFPAVTIRNVGSNGGQAAAFTFDLARSIVYTRQGNPAWAGQERDGVVPARTNELFIDWVDLNKVQIPQADEQQRLLANLVEQMNLDVMPLPRFWYLPNGNKAVLVMTGDDHDQPATDTSIRFADYFNAGTAGGQPIRASSYIYTGTLSNSQAAQLVAQGFEIGLHPRIVDSTGYPRNWTSKSELTSIYASQLSAFESAYPSLPSPLTSRMHGVVWSDYDSQPQVEFSFGIRLDTNYYYWGDWTGNRPGMFTGSGLPMRFAKAGGAMIDVYQATTQLVDENTAFTWPYQVDTLLNNALGPTGYYGAFTVNAHTDDPSDIVPDAVVNSAKAHNVPIITSEQLLNFVDARNGSYFSNLSWNASTRSLQFSIAAADGAGSVKAMLPLLSAQGSPIVSLSRNGVAVSYSVQTIKGITYAFFDARGGAYVASYASDSASPTVTTTSPAVGATDIRVDAQPSATFSEPVQPSSITMTLTGPGGASVPGTVVYDSSSSTASFIPASQLLAGTAYTLTISAAKDTAGNSLASPVSSSFTTLGSGPFTLFGPSSQPANPSANDNGAVEVGVKFTSDVSGTVTGIRFYKGTGNTGTHVGSLWTSNGTLLARATFSNETATGWQQVNFSSPVTVAADTLYIVSYHTNTGHYAYDYNTFTAASVDNGYLHAPSSSAVNGNGVYVYSANPAFPTFSYRDSNLWVDVVFAVPGNAVAPLNITTLALVSNGADTLTTTATPLTDQVTSFNTSLTQEPSTIDTTADPTLTTFSSDVILAPLDTVRPTNRDKPRKTQKLGDALTEQDLLVQFNDSPIPLA